MGRHGHPSAVVAWFETVKLQRNLKQAEKGGRESELFRQLLLLRLSTCEHLQELPKAVSVTRLTTVQLLMFNFFVAFAERRIVMLHRYEPALHLSSL